MRLDHTLSKAPSRGLTLVELMVGITVAMIGLLFITAVLENSSRHKRTTASGADAQTSGAIASHMIETDARMAGYAISNPSLLGCEIYGYDEGASPARNFVFSFVPVTISAGVANDYGVPDN
jgi:Tfp pilus assembly protein PilW